MRDALHAGVPLPVQELRTPAGDRVFPARLVPPPPTSPRPAWLAHTRLRRASRISHYALAACLEALDGEPDLPAAGLRLGIVASTHAGSLRYSERFYDDVLRDASTASPILFPETVINAPTSHVAAYLGCTGPCNSLIADQTAFVQAVWMGVRWLLEERVDRCLVVGMDEAAWTFADALGHLAPGATPAEGAGALLLAREPGLGPEAGVELGCITDPHVYARLPSRLAAARAMRGQLPAAGPGALLVDSRCGSTRVDRAEERAWADWNGSRLSPRRVLGEGLAAATAWQFVAACTALKERAFANACLSVVGGHFQAIGARLAGTMGAVADVDSPNCP